MFNLILTSGNFWPVMTSTFERTTQSPMYLSDYLCDSLLHALVRTKASWQHLRRGGNVPFTICPSEKLHPHMLPISVVIVTFIQKQCLSLGVIGPRVDGYNPQRLSVRYPIFATRADPQHIIEMIPYHVACHSPAPAGCARRVTCKHLGESWTLLAQRGVGISTSPRSTP